MVAAAVAGASCDANERRHLSHRRLYHRPAGHQRPGALARSESGDLDSSIEFRFDRTATIAAGNRRFCSEPVPGSVRTTRRAAAGIAALWGAVGAALAGCGPLHREPGVR